MADTIGEIERTTFSFWKNGEQSGQPKQSHRLRDIMQRIRRDNDPLRVAVREARVAAGIEPAPEPTFTHHEHVETFIVSDKATITAYEQLLKANAHGE